MRMGCLGRLYVFYIGFSYIYIYTYVTLNPKPLYIYIYTYVYIYICVRRGPVRGEFGSRLKGLYARQDMMAEFWHRQKEAFALRVQGLK